ncbi:MAG: hypothetical protein AAF620_12135 [Bacteroidota bacterium]
MKIQFSFLFLSAFLMLIITGCDDDDGDNVSPIDDAAYLIQVETQSPDGDRLVYMVVLPSLDSAINLDNAIEFSGSARLRTYDEKVYIYDSETMEVLKLEFNENDELVETDKFSMAGTGATFFNGTDAIVSNTGAAVVLGSIGKLVFWSPENMEITAILDLVDDLGLPETASGLTMYYGGTDASGRAFFSVGTTDFTGFVNHPGARVMIVDPDNQTAEIVEDLSLSQGTSGNLDDDGDYYFVGDAFFTLGRYAIPPFDTDFSINRINAGTNSFDPDFQLLGTDLNDNGYEEIRHLSISGDRFVAGVIEASTDSIATWGFDVFSNAQIQLYAGSTSDWKGTKLSGQGNFQFLFSALEVDGDFYFATTDINARDADDFAGLYKVEGTNLVKVNETVGFIRQVYRIR